MQSAVHTHGQRKAARWGVLKVGQEQLLVSVHRELKFQVRFEQATCVKSVPKCSCGNRQWGIGAILQTTSLRSTANRPPWPRSRPTPSRPPHPLPQARLRFTCQGRSGARQLCDRARPAAARPWCRRAHPPNSTRVRAHSARVAAAPPSSCTPVPRRGVMKFCRGGLGQFQAAREALRPVRMGVSTTTFLASPNRAVHPV